ncbi:hypothetical protein EIK77_000337, partial [Talaromyces pinophilus]
ITLLKSLTLAAFVPGSGFTRTQWSNPQTGNRLMPCRSTRRKHEAACPRRTRCRSVDRTSSSATLVEDPNHDDLHEGVTCPVLPSPRSLTEASSPPGPRCRAEEMVSPRQEAIDGFLLFGHLHEAPQERVCPDVEEWRILDARGTLLYSQDRCHNRSVQTRYLNGEAREWVDSSSQRFCGRPGFVEEALRWMMEGTIVVLDLPNHLVRDMVVPTFSQERFL